MLGLGILRRRVDEHLQLVELMHADDAARVLAVGARLAPVAGRPAGVALRPRRQVDDLVHVVPGQGHLARADEIEVVLLEVVDLVGVLPEEAGAAHHLGTNHRGWDERDEAGLQGAIEREHHEGELESCADAGQEVEAAARHLRAALHVDRREHLTELQVIARREVEHGGLAVGAQRDEVVFAPRRNPLDDDVLDLRHGRIGCLFGGGHGVLGRLDPLAELLRLGDERGLLVLRRLGHALAVGVLRGAQLLEGGDRGPAVAVGGYRLVDRGARLPSCLLRALDQLWILAEEDGIDHLSSVLSGIRRLPRRSVDAW